MFFEEIMLVRSNILKKSIQNLPLLAYMPMFIIILAFNTGFSFSIISLFANK